MDNKLRLNKIFNEVATTIDISDDMFDAAEKEYDDLGKWIDAQTPAYNISIYPQGSFALGTVVKPITDEDDYDLDIVCQFEKNYGLTAKELKVDVVKPLLVRYKKSSKDIENKKRCWHVEYDDIPHFHMDIIPAYRITSGDYINITNHNEDIDTYEYIGSNPSGYIKWFFKRCERQRELLYQNYVREHRLVVNQAEIEDVKRRKVKTPLQRVVQLLKRHRDIMFADDNSGNKPISIIITTIAATLYQNEGNILDALTHILEAAPNWIISNKRNGRYYIENPSYSKENFADKWNSNPERAETFFKWLNKAKEDMVVSAVLTMPRIDMGSHIKNCFGNKVVQTVFIRMAEADENDIVSGELKVDSNSGNLTTKGTITVPPTHHYGK